MPRRVTPEERMSAWTQFASAALTGFIANPQFSEMSCDETIEYAKDCADGMMDKWAEEFDVWLEIQDEVEKEKALESESKENEH